GLCHQWLATHYWSRDGRARIGSYICARRDRRAKPLHQSVRFSARLLDQAIVREVLSAIRAPSIETMRIALEDAQHEHAAIAKAHARQLQQAEDAVAKARQEYLL